MNTFGKNIRISLFGESHGKYIGVTIDGFPSNIIIDEELIKENLRKRQGDRQISTLRQEENEYEIISGLFNNKTTGAPLTFLIKNNDVNSSSYQEGIIRPNHGDYPTYVKHLGANDYRGGGHTSGRLTALLVIIGSLCEQLLNKQNIKVYSHIIQIKDLYDDALDDQSMINKISQFQCNDFMVSPDKQEKAVNLIKETKENNDSLACRVETFVTGIPVGLGEPFFDSFESVLSHLLFSIPGLKGVLFGNTNMVNLYGSEQIDQIKYNSDGELNILNNNQGGINAGLTNGGIIKFTSTFKAPSSINQALNSINIKTKENIQVTTTGRHDPIIGIRALPVINSVTYWAILDLLMELNKYGQFR